MCASTHDADESLNEVFKTLFINPNILNILNILKAMFMRIVKCMSLLDEAGDGRRRDASVNLIHLQGLQLTKRCSGPELTFPDECNGIRPDWLSQAGKKLI